MESLAKTLKLLGHPDRLRILAVLRRGELTVSELTTVLDLSQPRVTQYIGSLEEAGLIERLREGSWVFVRLRMRHEGAPAITRSVLDALPADDPTLAADRARLDAVQRDRSSASERFFAEVANNRGQLSHEYLPSAPIEQALLGAAGGGPFRFMVDLGTGSGRMLALFAERVQSGTGIDRSQEMLRVARHALSQDRFAHLFVQLGEITQTTLADGAADLVTLHQVLHYLDDPATALEEAARLLEPDGTLLIADFETHQEEGYRDQFAHRRLGFDEAEISALLTEMGFDDVVTTVVKTHDSTAPDVLLWTAKRSSNSHRKAA